MKTMVLFFLACSACSVRALSQSEYLADGENPAPPAAQGIPIETVAINGASFASAAPPLQIDFILGNNFQIVTDTYFYVGPRSGGNGRQYIYRHTPGGGSPLFYGIIINNATEIQFSRTGQSSANSVLWTSSNPADIITLTKL